MWQEFPGCRVRTSRLEGVDLVLDVFVGLADRAEDLLFGRTVEDRGDRLEAEHCGRPPEVSLENLTDVHSTRHAERVEQDVDRRSVFEERHVLFGDDSGDDALVAVPTGHLVADGELPLGGDVDLDHLEHARGEFVAALHVGESTLLLLLDPPRCVARSGSSRRRGLRLPWSP